MQFFGTIFFFLQPLYKNVLIYTKQISYLINNVKYKREVKITLFKESV